MPKFKILKVLTCLFLVGHSFDSVLAIDLLNSISPHKFYESPLFTETIDKNHFFKSWPGQKSILSESGKPNKKSVPSVIFSSLTTDTIPGCDSVAGSSLSHPIDLGTMTSCFSYKNSQNTATCFKNSYGYPSNYAQASHDVHYKFTITQTMEVIISHCNTPFDTYMHLLDGNGAWIVSCDDYGPVCQGTSASIVQVLQPGTYYVVSEGYGFFNGELVTEITTRSTIYFDGQDDQVEVANNPLFNFGWGPFTIEALIKTNRTTLGSLQSIISKRNSTPYEGFIFGLWADGHVWIQLGGAMNVGFNAGPTVFDNKYHHVAVTRNANQLISFYLDGVFYYSTTRTANTNSEGGMRIGVDNYTYMPFDGNIKNVRLYNAALNNDEILYNATSDYGMYNNLIANWPLNDTLNSQKIIDLSAQSNFATMGTNLSIEYSDPSWVCTVATPEAVSFSGSHNRLSHKGEFAYDDTLSLSPLMSHLSIGPNPFYDETEIYVEQHSEESQNNSLEISNISGVIIMRIDNIQNNKITIGKEFSPGIYILKIQNSIGTTFTYRLLKLK